ncbi:MAG: DUF4267 domain-containing protein [Marmoricola sp.]
MEPITGLAYGRIAIGAMSLLSPSLTARLFLLDPRNNPQLSYMGRMFGSREIALGVITLASSGETRRRLVQLGVAVDGADAYTGIVTAASGAVPKKTGVLLALVAAAAVATGVLELQES